MLCLTRPRRGWLLPFIAPRKRGMIVGVGAACLLAPAIVAPLTVGLGDPMPSRADVSEQVARDGTQPRIEPRSPFAAGARVDSSAIPTLLAALDPPSRRRSADDRVFGVMTGGQGSRVVFDAIFDPPRIGAPRRGRRRRSPPAVSRHAPIPNLEAWCVAPIAVQPPSLLDDGLEPAIDPIVRPAAAVLSPPSLDALGVENRRGAQLGIAADTMRFDDRPGRLSTAVETGLLNGQPAAAMGLGYTLPDGGTRLNATGVSSVMAGQKTFGVTAVASIALN